MATKKTIQAVEPTRLPDSSVSVSKGTLQVTVTDFDGKPSVEINGVDTIHDYDKLDEFRELVSLAYETLMSVNGGDDFINPCCECCGCGETEEM